MHLKLDLNLKDKTAIITGATRGIGLVTALTLARNGADVFICGRNEDTLAGVVKMHKKDGLSINGLAGDVTQESFVTELVNMARQKTGRIDILVNNAGKSDMHVITLNNISTDLWDAYLNSHLKSAFMFCKEVEPIMRRQGSGKIINMAAAAALVRLGSAHFIAAKSGLIGLTKSLARELAKYNIQVNAVAPGLVDTPSSRKNFPPDFFERIIRLNPAKRIASPDDIAKAVLFFSSPLSDFINGQVLAVDGGFAALFE